MGSSSIFKCFIPRFHLDILSRRFICDKCVLFRRFQREQNTLIKSVKRCLMDVISSINFSNNNVPLPDEEDLIDLLFEYITLNQNLYENLSDKDKILFKEGILKPSLPFRMFLLQLLLKERYSLNSSISITYLLIIISY